MDDFSQIMNGKDKILDLTKVKDDANTTTDNKPPTTLSPNESNKNDINICDTLQTKMYEFISYICNKGNGDANTQKLVEENIELLYNAYHVDRVHLNNMIDYILSQQNNMSISVQLKIINLDLSQLLNNKK